MIETKQFLYINNDSLSPTLSFYSLSINGSSAYANILWNPDIDGVALTLIPWKVPHGWWKKSNENNIQPDPQVINSVFFFPWVSLLIYVHLADSSFHLFFLSDVGLPFKCTSLIWFPVNYSKRTDQLCPYFSLLFYDNWSSTFEG